jgi:DNA-binding PadR family transcriptional regulator
MTKRKVAGNDRHKKVLECLEEHGPQTYLEVEFKLGVSGVHRIINYLQQHMLIVGQPKKRGLLRVYQITDSGKAVIGRESSTQEAPAYQKLDWVMPTPTRPGAMDAFKLKSLNGSSMSYAGVVA